MLTALDFPDELLYADFAAWIRDDGGGSARLGLNFYAVEEERARAGAPAGGGSEVVHVKLPRSGAKLERGKPFGHVEFEAGTYDLVAPVSGEVLLVNRDLIESPLLLRRDPYGKGWLVDVEGVTRDDIDGLMDRERAVRHYSRFELPGALRAQMRIDPGRPWFASLSFGYGGVAVGRARLVPPAASSSFVPDWEVGDRWTIETRCAGVVRRYAFVYEGDARLGGEEVFCVRATEVPGGAPPAPFERVLWIRQEDFTLAAWDRVPLANRALAHRTYNERGRDVFLRTGLEDGFFLDHPAIPAGEDDETREVPAGMSREPVIAGTEDLNAGLLPPVTLYSKVRGGGTRLEVEMRADLPRLEGGTARLLSTQTWKSGAPWWTEASRTLEGKELLAAKLVEPRVG